jgi:rhodanese-related sulfurtransferase
MKIKLFTFVLSIFTMLNCNMQTSKNLRVIDVETFKKEIAVKNIQLIDVRTSEEFQAGAIPNAINMDVLQQDFNQKIKTLDASKPVYIYCRSGSRSKKAAQLLENAGFTKIIDLKGGFLNWK